MTTIELPPPHWARDLHGETEVYTKDDVLRAIEQDRARPVPAELPALPSPAHPTHSIGPLWSHEQVIEYARAAIRQALRQPAKDVERYRRLQILGVAPGGSRYLDQGLVLRFTNLDEYVDKDITAHPSRGEAK